MQNKWMDLFPSIVARAKTVQIVTSGISGHASGSLHLVSIWQELGFESSIYQCIQFTLSRQFLAFTIASTQLNIFLQMYADLQVLSPLVPTRETRFLRYCQQNVEEGTWAIVDFTIDAFSPSAENSSPKFKRRPSGCIIQDMPNGYSRVRFIFV